MDIERTLETQRLRLLRILAGLVLVLGVLAVGSVSRRFSEWSLGFVGSVLSRVEAAVRYLVITQACLMVDRSGLDVRRSQIAMPSMPEWNGYETEVSLPECRRRLRMLRFVLMDLPRHALRLLRRVAKQMRSIGEQSSRSLEACLSAVLRDWSLAPLRVERPPDKDACFAPEFSPLPGCRVGGAGG